MISAQKVFTGNSGNNRIEGTPQDDILYGRGGHDILSGHEGEDIIYGNSGNDRIKGGKGRDDLYGNSGADDFIFNRYGRNNRDEIMDFQVGIDEFVLDSFMFTTLKKGDLAAAAFHVGTRAHDKSDRIIFDDDTGEVYYDPDGTGSAKHHIVAKIENDVNLTVSDIFVL